MITFELASSDKKAEFYVETGAFPGVRRVAAKVTDDFNDVTGLSVTLNAAEGLPYGKNPSVVFATAGRSALIDRLSGEGRIDITALCGKREVYAYFGLENEEGGEVLLIAGSDKLGTIYGAFELSELMGVSPLKYWSDTKVHRTDLSKESLNVLFENGAASKEPSVRYRGFFINDEWPCYGNWTFEHFGGFNAEMYDHVFELLLRLKGNYLWPAMWSSSFALDGPGLASYELADEYGIYIGNSHHEPCLRAGEEYSKVRGRDSIYGDAWNFHTNTEGISRFWRDSMMERGGFNSVVTVGMRGEADSKILGENATLKDNIDLLKKVIVAQQEIIGEAEQKYNKKFPKMLALYKEVEPFYYGDENTEGLCDWDVLDDVILMLCEDNYGYTRTLPTEKMLEHKAGFGMYYHVDYHGAPISYEWVNSTPLTTIWEQMSQAYDHGVKELWILNVGDLKHNEFPLSYFMDLAYDFDRWGTDNPNSTMEYTKEFMLRNTSLSTEKAAEFADLVTEAVRINGIRRPEAMNAGVFDPVHFGEADAMIKRCQKAVASMEAFLNTEDLTEYNNLFSLAGFQVLASMNNFLMHLYAGKNALLASQGRKAANKYADLVTECIKKDEELKEKWAGFAGGKWKGMELAPHIGFIKWNEDGSRYPLRTYVEPVGHPRMFVVKSDAKRVYDKTYGQPMTIDCDEFLYEGRETLEFDICNTGTGEFDFEVNVPETDWLKADVTNGTVSDEQHLVLICKRDKLPTEPETVTVGITGGDTRVNISVKGCRMAPTEILRLPEHTYLENSHGFSMLAERFALKYEPEGTGFVKLEDYGIYGSGMKAYPDTRSFKKGEEPWLLYNLYSTTEGQFRMEAVFAPTSPLSQGGRLSFGISVNGEEPFYKNTVSAGYKSGENSDPEWSKGALDHRRSVTCDINLKKGINTLKLLLPDAGLVPLKIQVYRGELPVSYLGLPETLFIE